MIVPAIAVNSNVNNNVNNKAKKTSKSFSPIFDCGTVLLQSDERQNVTKLIKPIAKLNHSIFLEQNKNDIKKLYVTLQQFRGQTNTNWPILDKTFGIIANGMHLSNIMNDLCALAIDENYYHMIPIINTIKKHITRDTLNMIPKCAYQLKSKKSSSTIINDFFPNMNNKVCLGNTCNLVPTEIDTMDIIVDLWKAIHDNLKNLFSKYIKKADIDGNIELSDLINKPLVHREKNIERYITLLCKIFDRLEKVLYIYKQSSVRRSNKRKLIKEVFEREL